MSISLFQEWEGNGAGMETQHELELYGVVFAFLPLKIHSFFNLRIEVIKVKYYVSKDKTILHYLWLYLSSPAHILHIYGKEYWGKDGFRRNIFGIIGGRRNMSDLKSLYD